jgi:hypothetical protein
MAGGEIRRKEDDRLYIWKIGSGKDTVGRIIQYLRILYYYTRYKLKALKDKNSYTSFEIKNGQNENLKILLVLLTVLERTWKILILRIKN